MKLRELIRLLELHAAALSENANVQIVYPMGGKSQAYRPKVGHVTGIEVFGLSGVGPETLRIRLNYARGGEGRSDEGLG
jgi:hypothetical protein